MKRWLILLLGSDSGKLFLINDRRFTTEEEVDYLGDLLVKQIGTLRDMSPLWDMVQEGIDLKTIQWSQPH
jgi:hypothetical protein